MRILIISDAWKPQINGVVRTYELLIPHLEQMGHDIHVISPTDFPHRVPMPGYREIELAANPRRALAKKITALKPDAIHIATEGPLGWAARALCCKRGWEFTTAYHTQFPDYAALRAAKYAPFLYMPVRAFFIGQVRRFHRDAKALMTTTHSIENQLRSWSIKTPFHRVTRGIDADIFNTTGPVADLGNSPHPVALYVGRVAIEKNIREFLEMKWDGTKVIVGDGPDRARLMKDYPDAIFTGKKTGHDLASYYRAADVFVFPSRTDTFGMVLIEALACGLPVAAFPVPGPIDIVTDETLGALSNDLSAAAHQALQNGSADQRSTHVKNYYTWTMAAQQFADMHAA